MWMTPLDWSTMDEDVILAASYAAAPCQFRAGARLTCS
jgi:hypothetical protein